MPIWLRNYNINKIQEAIKRENDVNQGKETTENKIDRMPDEVKQMIINKSKIPIKNSK